MLAAYFSLIFYINLRKFLFIPFLVKSFYHENVLGFSCFFLPELRRKCVFFLPFIEVFYYIDWYFYILIEVVRKCSLLSCSTWTAIIKYHILGSLKNKFISHSSHGRKSKIRVAAWSGSGESSFLAFRWLPSLCVFTWPLFCGCMVGENKQSCISYYKRY